MIYQTLDTVFHPFSNTENRVKNKTHIGVILTNFYDCFEALDLLFDMTFKSM